MYSIELTSKQLLPEIAKCQMECFPSSLATKLGKAYVQKTLEWFLVRPNRFLFHIQTENKIVGYCGGFVPEKIGDGSSSGMLQYAFNDAIKGLLTRPWLLLHHEVRAQYPFIWRNVKRKLTGKVQPAKHAEQTPKVFQPYIGLVVIGVLPAYQGKGIAQALMQEFERVAADFEQREMVLSVKKDNAKAIAAYQKFGLRIKEELGNTYVMNKMIEI